MSARWRPGRQHYADAVPEPGQHVVASGFVAVLPVLAADSGSYPCCGWAGATSR